MFIQSWETGLRDGNAQLPTHYPSCTVWEELRSADCWDSKSDSPGCKARGIEALQLFDDGDEFKLNNWLNLSEQLQLSLPDEKRVQKDVQIVHA